MTDTNKQKTSDRAAVRVAVYFPVRWRIPENPEQLASLITHHRTCDRFSAPPSAFSDMPADLADLTEYQDTSPQLYNIWMSMERKLDHLIWLMSRESFDDPAMEDAVALDLSVGGASILVKNEIPSGALIHLRMTPPTFPVFLIEALAKVITSKQNPEEGGGWLHGIEFTAINKNDSEDLFTYIFKRQREILRETSA